MKVVKPYIIFACIAILICPHSGLGQISVLEDMPPFALIEKGENVLSAGNGPVEIRVTNTGIGQFDWARITLVTSTAPPVAWNVKVSTITGTELGSFNSVEFSLQRGKYVAETPIISVPVVRLSVEGSGPELSYFVSRGRARAGVETTIGDRNLIPIERFDQDFQRKARAIVIVEYARDGSLNRCNGFLLSERLVITNAHCISTKDVLSEAVGPRIYLDYRNLTNMGQKISIQDVLYSDPKLDMTILQLEESQLIDPSIVVAMSDSDPPVGTMLRVIQHYRRLGWRKMVSEDDDCMVVEQRVSGRAGAADVDFTHGCDTHKGSSGTGVILRNQFVVVGLHHWGRNPGKWKCNKAVRVAEIGAKINALARNFPEVYGSVNITTLDRHEFDPIAQNGTDCD